MKHRFYLFSFSLILLSCTQTPQAQAPLSASPQMSASPASQETEPPVPSPTVSPSASSATSSATSPPTSPSADTSPETLSGNYAIVDTGVRDYYSDTAQISAPAVGAAFYGQDAHYQGNAPNYTEHGDGTISDNVTGLMWQQKMDPKMSFETAQSYANASRLGGYSDWRLPSLKELYSLIQFTGLVKGSEANVLFIDTQYFEQPLGDTSKGEREIDAQVWSATEYVSTTMRGDETVFGVNFIDGRIKGYPKYNPRDRSANAMYVRLVRGPGTYGQNNFVDNGDGTVSDLATGLMWQQGHDGQTYDWESALKYAEGLTLAGHSDWRLPNAKELHSIVDYSRSPKSSASAAIDPVFEIRSMANPAGEPGQYPYFWTSTSHLDGMNPYASGVYFAFGLCEGQMNNQLLDVHGAGCQRSDPKSGKPSDYPAYFGPQGDVRYVFNAVRAVRDIR